MAIPLSADDRRIVYARLVRGFADTVAGGLPVDSQWQWLMAAHVVGQHDAGMHFDSHCRMLALARRTRDRAEIKGQLLRLALLPIWQVREVPRGNIGRAAVPVTRPMRPPAQVQSLIEWATDWGTLHGELPLAR